MGCRLFLAKGVRIRPGLQGRLQATDELADLWQFSCVEFGNFNGGRDVLTKINPKVQFLSVRFCHDCEPRQASFGFLIDTIR